MNPSLDEFISEVKRSGMANANRYFVAINGADKAVGLFCDNAQLPGTTILSTPARTFGEVREVPYELQFDPVNLSFYIDNNWMVKKFFDDWRIKVFDFESRVSGYYKEYVRDVTIYCYNKDNQESYTVKLYEAFPKTIGSVALDYGNKEVPKLAVTLQYRWWEPLVVSGPASRSGSGFVEDLKTGIFGNGHRPANSGGTVGQSAFTSSFSQAMEFAGMDGVGMMNGIPGGFNNSSIDFNNILGDYFSSDPFLGNGSSQYLASFSGFQNTFNSFKSNPKGAVGNLGNFFT
jgi:hypothetical protein